MEKKHENKKTVFFNKMLKFLRWKVVFISKSLEVINEPTNNQNKTLFSHIETSSESDLSIDMTLHDTSDSQLKVF